MLKELPTPALLVDRSRLEANIQRMQSLCSAAGIELWPHIKTHKMVEIARMQLETGAAGLVCAKLGEAEAMLPSGVRRLFIAFPLVDPLHGPRLRALAARLDELIVAVTSEAQAAALCMVLNRVDLRLPAMMAVDTGLGREGVRSVAEAERLAAFIERQPQLTLRGFFTHEGHAYGVIDRASVAIAVAEKMAEVRDRINPGLPVWPGSTVTAVEMAGLPGIAAVRPGTYIFGDLWQAAVTGSMQWENLALTVLTTVVDRPEAGLALIDAGTKTLAADRIPDGRHGSHFDRSDIHITRCSEEHGFATGSDVDSLSVGDRIRIVPAHVCPAVNLADEAIIVQNGAIVDTWRIAARGCVQ